MAAGTSWLRATQRYTEANRRSNRTSTRALRVNNVDRLVDFRESTGRFTYRVTR